MRGYHILAVVAVFLIGFGVKLTFFNAPTAEAESTLIKGVMDISMIHQNANSVPVQTVHDMSFVFSSDD